MYFLKRVWLLIPLLSFLLCPGRAWADDTTVGVTLNGTTGHHLTSGSTQSVPLVPLPVFTIEHTHKRLRLRAEVVPPIGPLPLAASNIFAPESDPRVSFLSADALFSLGNGRFALGAGETIVNQRTSYSGGGLVQASRVVGARYTLHTLLYSTPFGRLEANLALNPSMHGVQYTMLPAGVYFGSSGSSPASTASDAEVGSMVDGALRWSVPFRRSTFVYGLRYINYTAKYSANGRLADHNHLLMPFIGVDLHLRAGRPPNLEMQQAAIAAPVPAIGSPRVQTRIGLTLLGTSGSHVATFGSEAETPFGLAPAFAVSQRRGRLEVSAEGILPAGRSNPFGLERNNWSYGDIGLRYFSRSGRIGIGVSDTVINQNLVRQRGTTFSRTRAEGLRYSATIVPVASARERFEITAGIIPYLHNVFYYSTKIPPPGYVFCRTCPPPKYIGYTYVTPRPGSLADVSLKWVIAQKQYEFSYGARYIHQAILLGSSLGVPGYGGPTSEIQHDMSFMPFISISTRLGH